MTRHRSSAASCIVFLLVALTLTPAFADPPKVLKATPDNGDADVDPTVAEIRVEFDQDMSPSGHSVCGGGPTFPEITAKPTWADKRTIVIPVKLKPGSDYRLSINCPAAQNFRSATGEACEPYPISFKTRKAGETSSEPKLTREQNAAAIETLRKAIDEKYAYRDLHKVDWKKAFEENRERLEAAETPAAFGRIAAKLLERAKDLHNSVKVGEMWLPTAKRSITPNVRAATLEKQVPKFEKANDVVWTGQFDDGIGYINILTWGPEDRGALKAAYDALDKFVDAKSVIIDVRMNSGGDETLAREFAACFVIKPAVYSKNTYRDPSTPSGFTEPIDRKIEPRTDRKTFRGRVAVLMGRANMSSCESFLLMMKTSSKVRLFGEKSFGSSGNPKPHDLGNGVTVLLSSWQDMTPSGALLEDKGIEPDTSVKTTPKELESDDPVLKAALEWLRK